MNEDDQVEALKRWWKENGKAVIGGAVLGLAIVGGWQGWQRYSTAQAERASAYYEQFTQALRRGDDATAQQQGERLLGEYGDSTYGVLAALQLARIAYAAGRPPEAQERLRWAIANADDPALVQVAQLRLGRLLLDSGDLDGAAELAAKPVAEPYAGEFTVLRGDIARARGDEAAARRAYEQALVEGVSDRALLLMKLAELGVTPATS
jgi:predicted negative regulator of RcsB-dependent stress response